MAFTVTFPTTGPCPDRSTVEAWLKERGEPFEIEGDGVLRLRAVPVWFTAVDDRRHLQAAVEVTSGMPISRVVDLLFAVSVNAGDDVRLSWEGAVTRPALWMRFADEQDRLRLAESLGRARERGNHEEITKRLWAFVATLRPGCDDRWDEQSQRVVQLLEVGEADGIDVESASWHTEDPQPGDVIPVPVRGWVHTLAWRWFSEAYPSLAEAEHTHH